MFKTLLLLLILTLAAAKQKQSVASEPVGFGKSFISPRQAYHWSSTGMSGLDHHDPIDKVTLTSKKTIPESDPPKKCKLQQPVRNCIVKISTNVSCLCIA